ncbi:hypothetical protein N8Z47_02100 [Salibacteraceae bacterium]|nr:hypothetical protein [Salibacteraceae bacterium]
MTNQPLMKPAYFLLLILLIGSSSCNKDKLVDELDQFEGTYEWEYTLSRKYWWSTASTISYPADRNYTAAIKFITRSNESHGVHGTVY